MSLVVVGGERSLSAQQSSEPFRYHVVGWVQWEDQRIVLDDKWLEGPNILALLIEVRFIGQTIALLVGPDRGVLDDIVRQVDVAYEARTPAFTSADVRLNSPSFSRFFGGPGSPP